MRYAYTTGTVGTAVETIPYTYGDANWKDKLTAYNGTAITYDAIGNPLNDGTWTYTWTAGRQLAQMSKDGMTIQYKYDHNGLRVGKVVNGTETKYVLHGKTVTHLTVGNDWMHFFYDAQGRPAKVRYNGTIYSYIYNLQGDIVGILDGNGNVVVEYKLRERDDCMLDCFEFQGKQFGTRAKVKYTDARGVERQNSSRIQRRPHLG